MGTFDRKRLEDVIDAFPDVRLLVVGDLVLDEYVWGDVERVSPEAPVPVVRVTEETVVLGGAANVARNLVALGAGAALVSLVGDDEAGSRVTEMVGALDIDPAGLVVVEGRPTTRKTRVVARNQQVVRFDRENVDPPAPEIGQHMIAAIDRVLESVDGVVVEDYGKGALSNRMASAAMQRFLEAGLPVAVDPKSSISPYRGAALVKPNLREAEALSGVAIRGTEDLDRAAQRIRQTIGRGAVAVTRGSLGMTLFQAGGSRVDVPTAPREVFDVQGAGDTSIAVLALSLCAGATLLEAAVIANAAAGVVIGKIGTATASVAETRELLGAAIEAAEEVS
jgi:D-beta-D-heptose 7-phosphate kinase/D-beta-D-heptose 1-phosphate adenosyltransferase